MTQPPEGVGIPPTGAAPAAPADLGRDQAIGTTPNAPRTETSTKDVATGQAASVAGDAKSEAASVAADAKADGRRVADTAAAEARGVAQHAGQEVRGLLHEARGEAAAQAGTQQQRVAELLRSISAELTDILDPQSTEYRRGVVSDLAEQASGRLQGVTSWLETREPQDVLDEVARFARRRPGTFLAVAAAAGLVVGRLSRGIADDARDDSPRAVGGGRPVTTRPATVDVDAVYADPVGDPYGSHATTTPVAPSGTPQRVAPPPTAAETLSPDTGSLSTEPGVARPGEAGR